MAKIAGWKKFNNSQYGAYLRASIVVWRNEQKHKNTYLHIYSRQVRDGKNPFQYTLELVVWQMTAYGGSKSSKSIIAKGLILENVKAKAMKYMRSHPRG